MSRSATAGELAVLARKEREVTHRVKVQNGSGTMIDYSNWIDSGKISRDVDQPVDGCTLNFVRSKSNQSLIQSLSPLRTDSVINRLNDGVTYSPAIDLNRIVTVELATTAIGSPVLDTDFKPLFKGTIDVVSFEQNPVVAVCRDLGAPLVDRWIETETTFGSGVPGSGVGGTAIQTVMQNIIDSVFGGGVYTLYTPVSPGADLNTYKQQRMSVMDALQDLAQQIGWDVRYRWDDGTSAFRLTLHNPPRSKTTPDYTFGPSAYHDITELSLDITDVRNALTGSYRNANSQFNRNTITRTDATSISKYGRRFMFIQEADVSPIDSATEMTTMLDSALADLKEPKASQSVNMPLHWTADLWDLYRYPPNSVHYDSNQDIAVVELTHEFAPNYHRTTVAVRGTPIGQYATWLGRGGMAGPGGGIGVSVFAPIPFHEFLDGETDDTQWNVRFDAHYGSGGGGTNLTYTIKAKRSVDSGVTLASGNASTFPRDLSISRDPKYDKEISFTVLDAATGLSVLDSFTMAAQRPEINAAADTYTTVTKHPANVAVRNSALTTTFGLNRHNDEQAAINTASKTFGVSYDSIPQMRALPQNWTLPGSDYTVDRKIEFAATGVSVAGYTARAVYSTGSSSSAQSENPAATLNGTPVASVALSLEAAVAFWNLANANTVLTTYYVHFDVDTTSMDAFNTLTINIYANDGTSSTTWTLVGSEYYTSGQTLSNQIIPFAAALALNWDVRILLDYEITPGAGHRATITAKACTYDKITAGSEVSLTGGAGNAVLFQAMEAP